MVVGLCVGLVDSELLDVECWLIIKSVYIVQIDLWLDDELVEIWFNLIFCGLFSYDNISDGMMFVYIIWFLLCVYVCVFYICIYWLGGDLCQVLEKIFDDYCFDVFYDDCECDFEWIDVLLYSNLLDWVCKDLDLVIELIGLVFYCNKGVYLVGCLFILDEQWLLVFLLLYCEGYGIQFDMVIIDEVEVLIIFFFICLYFMVDVLVLVELVVFFKCLLLGKYLVELYILIGFYKQGKSEFYCVLINYLVIIDDCFVMVFGVCGMVMSVFILFGFNMVFKIIKDCFNLLKSVDYVMVIQKYQLVKNYDWVGCLVDIQQFVDFCFLVSKFELECLVELLEVVLLMVVMEGDVVLICYCWMEWCMILLNIYLENVSEVQICEVLNDYGLVIK